MKISRLATLAGAALFAAISFGAVTPSLAQGPKVEFHVGGHYGGGWDRGGRHGGRHDGWDRGGRHGGWDRGGRHGRGYCSPREALFKARDMGLRRVDIARIDHDSVVVTGRRWGHRAWVVFDRDSRHCRVLNVRGL